MAEESVPERIQETFIEEEMKRSYLKYSMSVIVSRALPDVRDGLKPVHRRILYGMDSISLYSDRPYKKSANIVGEVMGKYHPHGDSAIYDTIVRMAQNFSLRYPLIDGQGNFGSIDGDPPAAMRYTEARMDKFAELILSDLEKNTVNFVPNYDDSTKEPTVLPTAFPNLLVNGSTGIAVGMATNMAPHNLREVISACQAMLANPDLPKEDLLKIVTGPDFPTGGIIRGRSGIVSAYLTGRGRVVVRARSEIEDTGKHKRIIVTEIPFQVNKSNLLERTADLVRDKVLEGISDIRDESDRDGIRVVYELKRDSYPDIVLNQLYKHTQLQDTFSINNLALVNNRPKTLTLKELIQYFLDHRHEIIIRRTQFDLEKAEARAHILEGLRIALDNIDAIIELIRASQDTETAKNGLMEKFGLSQKQAEAILDMRLQRLTGLEREKIEKEYQELLLTIEDLKDILANLERRKQIIHDELQEIADKYGDDRRSTIEEDADDITHLDLIPDEPMVITVSHTGYIKRIAVDTYKAQGRGGRGISGANLKDEDFIEHLFIANTHSFILVFTNLGRCHWLKVWMLPEAARTARGKALVNFIQLQPEERVSAFVPIRDFEQEAFLVFATRHGIINKMALSVFSRPRQAGVNAITLDDNDRLIQVLYASGTQHVVLGTRMGQANRFSMDAFRLMGRGTRGVRGINLGKEDFVIGMILIPEGTKILTITEKGYGKRSNPDEYRITNRGGKGVRNIRISEKNGPAVALESVHDDHDIIIITRGGTLIRIKAGDVSLIGRDTQGVRIIRVRGEDRVMAVTTIERENEDPETPTQPIDSDVIPEETDEEGSQGTEGSDLENNSNDQDSTNPESPSGDE